MLQGEEIAYPTYHILLPSKCLFMTLNYMSSEFGSNMLNIHVVLVICGRFSKNGKNNNRNNLVLLIESPTLHCVILPCLPLTKETAPLLLIWDFLCLIECIGSGVPPGTSQTSLS